MPLTSDCLIRSHLALALFMVSNQYTGHKTIMPHLVYTGDRIYFVAVYENEFVPGLVFRSPVKNVPFPIPVLGEITRPNQEV